MLGPISVEACPFHKMLRKLKVFAGFPVPAIQMWRDGKPDFRVADEEKRIDHAERKLCVICGEKLGEWSWYVGGPSILTQRLFSDPGMHRTCAEESMRLCPFLSGSRTHYRGGDDVIPSGLVDISGRPPVMHLMRAKTKDSRLVEVEGGILVYAGPKLESMREF